MTKEQSTVDVVIVGGSYAGLAAGMALGRAIRNVLIIDGGKPCNAQTPHSHNFLTQDGSTPAAIATAARNQVLAYPTVRFLTDEVRQVAGNNLDFQIETASGQRIGAKKVLFATGVKDQLPEIEGFAECWGISAIHCPYCHGYEYRHEATGLLINGKMTLDKARLIHHWTDQLTLFTNGASTIAAEDVHLLGTMGIPIVETPLQQLIHAGGYLDRVVLADGREVALKALYASVPFVQHCPVPEKLGCELSESGHIKVDGFQKTTVPGIFAAGDNTTPFRSVAAAVAAGTFAGACINNELIN